MLRMRLVPVALIVALTACAETVTPPPTPVVPAPPSAAPVASTAPAEPAPPPSYVVRGVLRGHDGKPMKLAHVHVGEQSTPVEANGSFRLIAPGPGFLPVRFTGVDHAELSLGLYFDGRPIDVEVTLGTHDLRPAPFAEASVVIYKPSPKDGRLQPHGFPQPVKKLGKDQYGAVILENSDHLFYALDDVARGHRVNGEGDSFTWDGQKSYVGRLARSRGAFRILLDAARMPPPGKKPGLRFPEPASRAARITALRFEADRRAELDGVAPPDPSFRAEITRALAAERDEETAAALRIAYLVPRTGLDANREEAIAIARDLLDRLPPSAPVWGLSPAAAITAVELTGRTPEREGYLDRLTEGLRDRETAAAFVAARIRAASRAGLAAELARLFGVMKERFAGTNGAHAVVLYDPARRVRPGLDGPDFDLPAMADPPRTPAGTRITSAGLRGKLTLVDFWGFWCVPCVAEMGNLHDVHERYRSAGLEVVSIAVRTKMPAMRQFRATRWPMPWRHVMLDDKNLEDTVDRFEIKSYPSPMLIGPDGKIIAVGDELRGDELMRTVGAAIRDSKR